MEFKIEQVALAINPKREAEAFALLATLGMTTWAHDTVRAGGTVRGTPTENVARLSFNYTGLEKARELEVIRYEHGANWLEETGVPIVSHVGMHCGAEELAAWRELLTTKHGLPVVQEVITREHTNPEIAGKRWYHYVIFGARDLIGTDVKFIVRRFEP